MIRVKRWYLAHQKAFNGAYAAGGAALVNALLDGHVDGGEVLTIVGAVAGAFGVVVTFPNKRRPSPHPHGQG